MKLGNFEILNIYKSIKVHEDSVKMAMLLAMFQKMKLVREKNQLALEQMQYESKLSRVQKNIANKNKYYAGLLKTVETQAQNMLNQYKYNIQSQLSIFSGGMMGMGNMFGGFGGFGGMYGTNLVEIDRILKIHNIAISPDKLEAIANGQITAVGDGSYTYGTNGNGKITKDEYNNYQTANRMFQQSVQQQQMLAQGLIQNATNCSSIFIEQQKAAIEMEQEEVIGELSYEETMLEMEKEERDMRLQRINQQIETYTQLVSQEAKNSAPTFGLG